MKIKKASSSDPMKVRSANMARIRGKNTRPEMLLRKELWRRGLRYRLGLRVEGVRPDIIFPAQQLVVFVDGCFWHGCPNHYVRPRSKTEFWALKLAVNTARDRRQTQQLVDTGWKVLRFWEHEIDVDLEGVIAGVINALANPELAFISRMMVVRVEVYNQDPSRENWILEDLLDSACTHKEERQRKLSQPSGLNAQNPMEGN